MIACESNCQILAIRADYEVANSHRVYESGLAEALVSKVEKASAMVPAERDGAVAPIRSGLAPVASNRLIDEAARSGRWWGSPARCGLAGPARPAGLPAEGGMRRTSSLNGETNHDAIQKCTHVPAAERPARAPHSHDLPSRAAHAASRKLSAWTTFRAGHESLDG